MDKEFQSLSLTSPTNPLRVDDDEEWELSQRRVRPRQDEEAIDEEPVLVEDEPVSPDLDFVMVENEANPPSRFRRRVRHRRADSDSPVAAVARFASGRRRFANHEEEENDTPERFSLQINDRVDQECQLRQPLPGEGQRIIDKYLQERAEKNTYVNQDAVPKEGDAADCGIKLHETAQERVVAELARLAKDEKDKLSLDMRDVLSADLCRETRRGLGDQRLDAIRKTLNNLGYTRSQFQRCFHDAFIRACLPIIFGDEWSTCCERVMKELGIDRIRPEVLIQTPRRFGKTVSVAMFVLACLLNVPGIKICVFSTGKRASGGLLTEIMDRLRYLPDGRKRVIKSNSFSLHRTLHSGSRLACVLTQISSSRRIRSCAVSEQLWISEVALGEEDGMNGARAKSMQNDEGISRLYSFPASVAG